MAFDVSVIIPTYNRAHYLSQALDSVLKQSLPPTEVIIIDDGSTDGTAELAKCFPPIVRYIRQKNTGPAAARNHGLREAKCTWVAFHDSDDLWVPEKLAIQSEFLSANAHLDFVFGHMVNFSETSEDTQPEILDRGVYEYLKAHATDLTDLLRWLLLVNPIPTPTVLFRRERVSDIGFFCESLRCGEDYDWWLRWALKARVGFIDRVLMKRRIHDSNIVSDRALRLRSVLDVYTGLQERAPSMTALQRREVETAIHRQRYVIGSEYYFQRRFGEAHTMLRASNPLRSPGIPKSKWLLKLALSALRASGAR